MTNHSAMKLGRKAVAPRDHAIPVFKKFMKAVQFPANYDQSANVIVLGVMLNNTLGCCTISGVGHKLQLDSALVRKEFTANDNDILHYYEIWDGYNPADPNSDQGGIEQDVLKKWLKQGFCGHRLVAFGYVNPKDHDEVRHLIWALNGLYIGVALPLSAQTQEVWGIGGQGGDTTAGSWGGHCVCVYGYTSDAKGNLKTIKFISWGKKMEMTVAFWNAYVDEAWGVLTAALVKAGKVPAGIDVAAMEAEVAQLRLAA